MMQICFAGVLCWSWDWLDWSEIVSSIKLTILFFGFFSLKKKQKNMSTAIHHNIFDQQKKDFDFSDRLQI